MESIFNFVIHVPEPSLSNGTGVWLSDWHIYVINWLILLRDHISFYVFVLYLVTTSDTLECTMRRRTLSVRLVIEPESRNFSTSLFKLFAFQSLSENSRINFLPPKTLNLYKFSIKMRTLAAPDCCMIWSGLHQCHRRGNRPRGVNGSAHVWELMDETSNTCSNNMNVTLLLFDVTIWLFYGHFVFDTVDLLYAVKIVARFYTV